MTQDETGIWTASLDAIGMYGDGQAWVVVTPGRYICEVRYGPDAETHARLIAAAPELLACLEDLLREIDKGTLLNARKIVQRADKAIRKARGLEE
jgi:hypothetical protein